MSRAGTFVSNLTKELAYKSFRPVALPLVPEIELDSHLRSKIYEAYLILGKLDGLSALIPNKELFVSMYIRKEALLTSQIEGTQVTLDDIFDSHRETNKSLDVQEVIHYIKAINHANDLLSKLPISIRFIKDVHRVLLSSTRGKDKDPGELRRTQNWIGPQGSTLKSARFVPPNIEDMHIALSNLEQYIHDSSLEEPLVKIAIIHYQFETIHPFLDGNGRIGRLLIALLLKHYDVFAHDTLYISYYLKLNRLEYYDRLTNVRTKGHFEAWVLFFIEGIIESAKHGLNSINALLELRDSNIKKLMKLTGKQQDTALQLFSYIEAYPIIDILQASKGINRAFNTVSAAVKTFINLGILVQTNQKSRYRVFAYEPYLAILRDGTT